MSVTKVRGPDGTNLELEIMPCAVISLTLEASQMRLSVVAVVTRCYSLPVRILPLRQLRVRPL